MQYDIRDVVDNLKRLSDDEARAVGSALEARSERKGTVLIQPGKMNPDAYIVVKGCVRSYYIQDGNEITTELYTRGEFCTDISSYGKNLSSRIYLECASNCEMIVVRFSDGEYLLKHHPRFIQLCQENLEDNIGRYQERVASMMGEPPEQRYLSLMETRPELFQLLPLHIIAGYLGIKPESLSRIRRRLAKGGS